VLLPSWPRCCRTCASAWVTTRRPASASRCADSIMDVNQVSSSCKSTASLAEKKAPTWIARLVYTCCLSVCVLYCCGCPVAVCRMQAWLSLPGSVRSGGNPTREEALQAVAVVNRVRRLLSETSGMSLCVAVAALALPGPAGLLCMLGPAGKETQNISSDLRACMLLSSRFNVHALCSLCISGVLTLPLLLCTCLCLFCRPHREHHRQLLYSSG
jgi:hypothetical protein